MRRFRLSPPLIALALAVILFFVGGVIRPGFTSYRQAVNILLVASFLGIVAAGQTLVIISGYEGVDLSVGAVVTLGAILVFRLVDGQNAMILPGLLAALASGAVIGFLNGIGIIYVRIPPLVMTLGMTAVVQGLILIVTRGVMQGGVAPLMARLIRQPLIFNIPGIVFFWLLLGALMWLLLERTPFGKRVFAVGVNRVAASLSGVRVPWVVVLTYTLSGLLAALTGFVLLGYTGRVFLRLGEPYTLPSVAAVVIGGTLLSGGYGSYWGTMAGALVLTLITSLLTTLQLAEAWRLVVYGATLLVLLLFYGRQRALRQ